MGWIFGHLPELIIVLVLILIIWGPGKLPSVGGALGRAIREFREARAEPRDGGSHPGRTGGPSTPA